MFDKLLNVLRETKATPPEMPFITVGVFPLLHHVVLGHHTSMDNAMASAIDSALSWRGVAVEVYERRGSVQTMTEPGPVVNPDDIPDTDGLLELDGGESAPTDN